MGDEGFLLRFRITSVDPEAAAAIFDPPMRAWLESTSRERLGHDLCYEISGPWVMVFTKLQPASSIPRMVGFLSGFIEHLPQP